MFHVGGCTGGLQLPVVTLASGKHKTPCTETTVTNNERLSECLAGWVCHPAGCSMLYRQQHSDRQPSVKSP